MKKYYTADFKTRIKIEEFDTKEQALSAIELYEKQDRINGCYVPKDYVILRSDYHSELKRIREEKKLSQSKLSEITGVNVRLIQDYEQGHKQINNAKAISVYRLAEALGCTVGDILEL